MLYLYSVILHFAQAERCKSAASDDAHLSATQRAARDVLVYLERRMYAQK